MPNTEPIETRPAPLSNVYYTLQVDRGGLEGDSGKWRLTVTECVADGSAVPEQGLYFERLFDSREEAVQHGSTWAAVQRAPIVHVAPLTAAITHVRSSFRWYGFDVSAYGNHQVSSALLDEAAAKPQSSADLFIRAFQRLRGATPKQL